jgi:hypothetical protein
VLLDNDFSVSSSFLTPAYLSCYTSKELHLVICIKPFSFPQIPSYSHGSSCLHSPFCLPSKPHSSVPLKIMAKHSPLEISYFCAPKAWYFSVIVFNTLCGVACPAGLCSPSKVMNSSWLSLDPVHPFAQHICTLNKGMGFGEKPAQWRHLDKPCGLGHIICTLWSPDSSCAG